MAEDIFTGLTMHIPSGWTGVVGPNGQGKTTLLLLAAGLLAPDQGRITRPSKVRLCRQRTDRAPARAGEFLGARGKQACRLKSLLEIGEDWPDRWESLSHGERKRFQIAEALYGEPDLLALDEPVNHLDAQARDLVFQALRDFSGIGLLVAHDRDLLDSLCLRCAFVESGNVIMRPGGYSRARAQADLEDLEIIRKREKVEAEASRLKREFTSRRQKASRSARLNPKKGLAKGDSDARAKADLARVTGMDAARGNLLGQMKGRMGRVQKDLAQTPFKKENPTGIAFTGEIYPGDYLFHLPEGEISLGSGRRLRNPVLHMFPRDRLALTGPNGSGKSTLFRAVRKSLNLPDDRVVFLPQELPAESAVRLRREILDLDRKQLGWVMNIVSRLGSNPDRLLESELPSPGEARKMLLALGLSRTPWIIMLDEPTNHMDVLSVEALEAALNDCECGLFFISHDRRFTQKLASDAWRIEPEPGRSGEYKLMTS